MFIPQSFPTRDSLKMTLVIQGSEWHLTYGNLTFFFYQNFTRTSKGKNKNNNNNNLRATTEGSVQKEHGWRNN